LGRLAIALVTRLRGGTEVTLAEHRVLPLL
jgi:hypothetical protein